MILALTSGIISEWNLYFSDYFNTSNVIDENKWEIVENNDLVRIINHSLMVYAGKEGINTMVEARNIQFSQGMYSS